MLEGVGDAVPEVGAALAEIDAVAADYGHRPVGRLVMDRRSPSLEQLTDDDPDHIALAVFAASIGCWKLLGARLGLVPDVVFGHSFGEVSALTVAGVLTVGDGARVVCERIAAIRDVAAEPGGLLAVGAGASRTAHLVAAVDDWRLALAAENSPVQTVVSGPNPALDRLAEVADVVGVQSTRLRVARPFHNPVFLPAVDAFADALAAIPLTTARIRCYSDVLGRYLNAEDDIRSLLASHLVKPVHFVDAVRALHADGVGRFVECGARDVLTRLLAECLPPVPAVAPLRQRVRLDALESLFTDVAANAVLTSAVLAGPSLAPVPAPRAVSPKEPDPEPAGKAPSPEGLPGEAELIQQLRELYSEYLEYPADVVTDDAELEGDLGVDSLKQADLLTRALDRYGVRQRPADLRATRYPTVAHVAALLRELASR